MVHSIEFRPKYALALTCLLVALAAGIFAETAAQSTNTSIDLNVNGLTGPLNPYTTPGIVFIQTVVNGTTYCLYGLQISPYPPSPIIVQLTGGYQGYCDAPSGSGASLGPTSYHPSQSFTVTGTITISLSGPGPTYPLTVVVNLTAGPITITSKVTGVLDTTGGACNLSNLVSQYATATGAGLNLNLQLLSNSGTCSAGALALTLTYGKATIIPEYPLGLPILTILMLIAYGLIKRRSRNPKNTQQ